MKKPSTSTALPALAAALALALAGCGGGGGDGTPGTGVTPPGDTTPDTETTPEGDTTQNIRPTPGGGGGGPSGPPQVSLVAMDGVPENAGTARITVNLSVPAPTELMLNYAVDGTAQTPVTIDQGDSVATITVPITGSAGSTLNIALIAGTGYELEDTSTPYMLMIGPPETTPTVTFSMPTNSANEGDGTARITVNLSVPAPTELMLNYAVDGTAQTPVTIAQGASVATITVPITDDNVRQDSIQTIVIITAGTGYDLGNQIPTFTLTVTDNDGTPPPPPPPGVLGPMDQAALDIAIGNVTKPEISGDNNICGTNADCVRIVNKLEAQAKAYAPLSRDDLARETVAGVGTYHDANGDSSITWTTDVGLYQIELVEAIIALEGAAPPYAPDAAHIAAAVTAAVNNRDADFSYGVNKIANDFTDDGNDDWGLWIKEGERGKLYYWHVESDDRVSVTSQRTFFGAYDGTAMYQGAVDGYAHYTDGDDAIQAGKFEADISLTADFDDTDATGASITGMIDTFEGDGADPAWGAASVTLNADGTASGGATGFWRSDHVYGVDGEVGTDRRPGEIVGRTVLTFGGANPGAAAGVFSAARQ